MKELSFSEYKKVIGKRELTILSSKNSANCKIIEYEAQGINSHTFIEKIDYELQAVSYFAVKNEDQISIEVV